jgi:hypothetical protein
VVIDSSSNNNNNNNNNSNNSSKELKSNPPPLALSFTLPCSAQTLEGLGLTSLGRCLI